MTPREQAEIDGKWLAIRKIRDHRMAETDWTQMIDSPLSPEKAEEFKLYRQELRDIPQSVASPDDVVWPEKPTV